MSDDMESYEKPVPDAPEPQSPMQRLRISVPYLETAITMGEGSKDGQLYEDDYTPIFHFPGFGVTTQGNVHIEARGPRKTSRVKIQTHGDVSIHSNESCVNIGGYQGVTLGTDANAVMVGATGTFISGGAFGAIGGIETVNCGLQDPMRDKHPKTPDWVTSANKLSNFAGDLLNVLSLSMIVRQNAAEEQKKKESLKDIDIEKHSKPSSYVSKLGLALNALGIAKSAYTMITDEGKDPEPPSLLSKVLAGTTIIGQGGMALASPNTIGMLGGLGIGLFSPGRHLARLEQARLRELAQGDLRARRREHGAAREEADDRGGRRGAAPRLERPHLDGGAEPHPHDEPRHGRHRREGRSPAVGGQEPRHLRHRLRRAGDGEGARPRQGRGHHRERGRRRVARVRERHRVGGGAAPT